MTVSDRIAVMDKGVIMQVATPAEIYEAPNSRYVADFIGDINMLEGKLVSKQPGVVQLDCDGLALSVAQDCDAAVGSAVAFAIRPEKLRISLDKPAETGVNAVRGEVWDIGYLGDFTMIQVMLGGEGGQLVKVALANRTRRLARPFAWDDKVWLSWDVEAGVVLPP